MSYTSVFTAANNCDSTIVENIIILPVYSTNSPIEICSGSSFTFADGTLQENITSDMSYTSVLTAANNCDSTIVENIIILPIYSTNSQIEICSGSSFTFADGTVQENITSDMNYTSVFNTVNNCDSTIVENIIILPLPNSNVSIENNVLTSEQDNATYQWLDCENNFAPLLGETNQNFIASENGNYAVEISLNDCYILSDCYEITSFGIVENSFNNNIILFPNPTNDKINIDLGEIYSEITANISTENGQHVRSINFYNQNIIVIDLYEKQGAYLITLISNNQKAVLKVVKN